MRKWLSFVLFLMLMRFVTMGQVPPTLQITSNNGGVALSWNAWNGGSPSLFLLQTTTNLSTPIMWSNLPFAFNSGFGAGNVTMANSQQFFRLAQALPIFQFAIFYNIDMELNPGANMYVIGPVFSDAGIWAGSSTLTFSSSVAAVGIVATNASDPFATNYTGSGFPRFTVQPVSSAGALNLTGLGTNSSPIAVRSLLNLPPSGTDPYSSTGQLYFINQTDLVISNSPSGVISAYVQDLNNGSPLSYIPPDVTRITTNGSVYTTNHLYSFATNTTFYDYREGKTVQAVQLNVGALTNWLAGTIGSAFNSEVYNNTGHYIDSVYVYNNAPYTSTSLPSVRVANGAVLPASGLTVVTPDPLYVLGNYNASGQSLNNGTNVVNTAPAALFGDSITALSTGWSDNYNSSTPLHSRPPSATTINAAVFEGIVPTVGANYSGGVENFIRLLENWSGSTTLTYNGSIVVMFPSQYATNQWQQPGIYYDPPVRIWSFDANFTDLSKLPPLTPLVENFVTP